MSEEGGDHAAPAAGAGEKGGDEQINVRVVNQEGAEVFFKIKRTTALKRLMEAYCSRQGLSTTAVRFLYDGERLKVWGSKVVGRKPFPSGSCLLFSTTEGFSFSLNIGPCDRE